MNAEEIRKKAIECSGAFQKMCDSVAFNDDTMSCPCEFDYLGESASCSAVYSYEHGFADGVEEGRNEVITELLETSKHDELSQKIAWDILERGIESGKQRTIAPFEREVENIYRETWSEHNLARFVFRIREIIELTKEDKGENV